MPLDLVTIPCRSDNYAILLHDPASDTTALVDAPEAGPILKALAARGWRLSEIWLTHHHGDHVEAVDELRTATGAEVTGAAADAHRLPRLERALPADASFDFAGHAVQTLNVPGHTVGHIAYWIPDAQVVFTGDSLMAGGCGRLFEGTPGQMWDSLSRLAALPPETQVCSGHEYTVANLRFAATLEPDNPDLKCRSERVAAARKEGRATVPSRLSEELATNPFLRAGLPALKAAVGMPEASDVESFAAIRSRKDRF